jgi:hypothetical protein
MVEIDRHRQQDESYPTQIIHQHTSGAHLIHPSVNPIQPNHQYQPPRAGDQHVHRDVQPKKKTKAEKQPKEISMRKARIARTHRLSSTITRLTSPPLGTTTYIIRIELVTCRPRKASHITSHHVTTTQLLKEKLPRASPTTPPPPDVSPHPTTIVSPSSSATSRSRPGIT